MDISLIVVGWVVLGLCVSFVAMIFPFRRSPVGLALDVGVAVAAAIAGGAFGRGISGGGSSAVSLSFGLAVAAAGLACFLLHVVVGWRSRRRLESAAR